MTSSMSSTTRRPAPGHHLTRGECRSWLDQHHEGRLDYHTGRGPRSLVVRYAVAADTVLVRVPTYNDLLQYAPGEPVTLEVDDRLGSGQFEKVTVTGTAAVIDRDPGALSEDWPADLPTRLIGVPIQAIDGYLEDLAGSTS
jgi:hypothetical protein